MSLTKQDLFAIKNIINNEIKPVKTGISVIKTDISTLKSDMKKVRKDLKTTINFFDKEYLNLKKYTTEIANQVDYPSPNF